MPAVCSENRTIEFMDGGLAYTMTVDRTMRKGRMTVSSLDTKTTAVVMTEREMAIFRAFWMSMHVSEGVRE